MTEFEWLTSTNPSEMLAFLRERAMKNRGLGLDEAAKLPLSKTPDAIRDVTALNVATLDAILAWNDGTVPNLAQVIYDETDYTEYRCN